MPALDYDLFRFTLLNPPYVDASRAKDARFPAGPSVVYDAARGAHFATLPPSQSNHHSEILGAIRLPFPLLREGKSDVLHPDLAEALRHICEAERVSCTTVLHKSASYPVCRAAGLTSPLVSVKHRLVWLFNARQLFSGRPDLVRDAYPVPDATFDTLIATTSDPAPAAKRRRTAPAQPRAAH